MNNLLYTKYEGIESNVNEFGGGQPAGKYGFVSFKNPDYLKDKKNQYGEVYRDERKYIYRKPNGKERREIVINTIIESKDRPFSIPKLARLLAVSERTLQTLLKTLREEGVIEVIPRYGKNGAQKSNAYRYTGEPCKFYGSGLNLNILYDLKQDAGFRHWRWYSMGFAHDKAWYDIYDLCKIKFEARIARGEYLRKNGLPLIVPEEVNFLVLRYAYWKGHDDVIFRLDIEHPCKNYQYSKDGTIKILLHTGEPSRTIQFFGHTFELVFAGSRENPVVEIYEQGEKQAVFTWFTENIIERTTGIDEEHTEQFFILGDFTAK